MASQLLFQVEKGKVPSSEEKGNMGQSDKPDRARGAKTAFTECFN